MTALRKLKVIVDAALYPVHLQNQTGKQATATGRKEMTLPVAPNGTPLKKVRMPFDLIRCPQRHLSVSCNGTGFLRDA